MRAPAGNPRIRASRQRGSTRVREVREVLTLLALASAIAASLTIGYRYNRLTQERAAIEVRRQLRR